MGLDAREDKREREDTREMKRKIFKRNAVQQDDVADCGEEGPLAPLIIGGETAEEGQFPWAAAIFIDSAWFCSGSLISASHLLTAAHCVDGAAYFDITLGTVDIRNPSDHRVEVTSYTGMVHPAWNPNTPHQ